MLSRLKKTFSLIFSSTKNPHLQLGDKYIEGGRIPLTASLFVASNLIRIFNK
jgi:hypothetical protein